MAIDLTKILLLGGIAVAGFFVYRKFAPQAAAGEMLAEFRAHQDPLVKRIADSYAVFRNRSAGYMNQSYGANFNSRALPIRWG